MHIQPLLGSVVGVASTNHWGQVLSCPAAYGVVEIEDPDGRARDWGVSVLSALSERITKRPKSLKAARDIAITCMEDRVKSLILLVPVGSVVYIVMLGEGRVSLKRNSMLSVLMDKPGAISGEVKEGDTIILMSKSVADVLSDHATTALFDHGDAPQVAEKMTMAIHTGKESLAGSGAGSAALILEIKGLIEQEYTKDLLPVVADSPVRFPLIHHGRRVWQTLRRVRPRHFHPRYIHGRLSTLPDAWRRPMVPVTLVLIVIFLLSVVLGIRRQMGQRVEERVARVLTQAGHAFDEGVALLELNPVKARERLTEAKSALEPIREGLAPSSIEGRETAKLYKAVVDQLTIAMQIHRAEPALYYDMALLKDASQIAAVGSDGDTLALLSGRGPVVASLMVSTKNGKIVGGGESLTGASLLTVHGEYVYVLAGASIHRISARDAKTTRVVAAKDAEWGTITSLVSYGGNLYLLDSGKSRIWKYVAMENGFSETREYLNPDTLPDLSQATGMAVDGGIWVGTKNGAILRFARGKEESFVPQGVEPAFGKTLVVGTSEEDKHLYVLDSDNKRVVVLDKDGVYLAQYVWTGNIVPTGIVASERLKLLLLLTDGKLYSLQLK